MQGSSSPFCHMYKDNMVHVTKQKTSSVMLNTQTLEINMP